MYLVDTNIWLVENDKGGESMKFRVIFTYDPEYKGYVADVPSLPGCMSQGKTLDEAIENIKDAIKGYLSVQQKHNRTVETREEDVFIGEVVV